MNRAFPLSALLCTFILTLAFAAEGRSELITFAFAGTVTTVSVLVPPDFQSSDFPDVGDPFTGFYTFDLSAEHRQFTGARILHNRFAGYSSNFFV